MSPHASSISGQAAAGDRTPDGTIKDQLDFLTCQQQHTASTLLTNNYRPGGRESACHFFYRVVALTRGHKKNGGVGGNDLLEVMLVLSSGHVDMSRVYVDA